MFDFIYRNDFYLQRCDGNGRKKPEREKEMKEKNPRLYALLSPFNNMEADCFPVSENAENKPDLLKVGGGSNLIGQKKKEESDAVRTGSLNLRFQDFQKRSAEVRVGV